MISEWLKSYKTPKDKADAEDKIRGSRFALNRLKEIFTEDEEQLNLKQTNRESLDHPNWQMLMAYDLGYKACNRRHINLVTLDQKDKIR